MPIAVGQPAPDFTLKDQMPEGNQAFRFCRETQRGLDFFTRWISAPSARTSTACFVNDLKQFEKLDAQCSASAWTASGRTRPSPKRWESATRCLRTSTRKVPVADKFGMYLSEKGITRQSDRDHQQGRKDRLVQKLRHSRGAGHERSRAGASRCEIRLYFGEGIQEVEGMRARRRFHVAQRSAAFLFLGDYLTCLLKRADWPPQHPW